MKYVPLKIVLIIRSEANVRIFGVYLQSGHIVRVNKKKKNQRTWQNVPSVFLLLTTELAGIWATVSAMLS